MQRLGTPAAPLPHRHLNSAPAEARLGLARGGLRAHPVHGNSTRAGRRRWRRAAIRAARERRDQLESQNDSQQHPLAASAPEIVRSVAVRPCPSRRQPRNRRERLDAAPRRGVKRACSVDAAMKRSASLGVLAQPRLTRIADAASSAEAPMATRTWDARTLPDERARSNACVTVVNTVPDPHTPRRDAGRPPELRVAPALPFGMTW